MKTSLSYFDTKSNNLKIIQNQAFLIKFSLPIKLMKLHFTKD